MKSCSPFARVLLVFTSLSAGLTGCHSTPDAAGALPEGAAQAAEQSSAPQRAEVHASGDGLHTAELMVEGTSCASCTVTIRKHLKSLVGVSDIRQGQSKKHVMVDFDPTQVSPEQIVQAVHDAGYEAEVFVYAKKS